MKKNQINFDTIDLTTDNHKENILLLCLNIFIYKLYFKKNNLNIIIFKPNFKNNVK